MDWVPHTELDRPFPGFSYCPLPQAGHIATLGHSRSSRSHNASPTTTMLRLLDQDLVSILVLP